MRDTQRPARRKSTTRESIRRTALLAALFVLLAAAPVRAGTLAEYRAKVEKAAALVERLRDDAEADADAPARDVEFERRAAAEIRAALPATEKIEWNGAAVETDNEWIGEKLKAYEEAAGDEGRRRAILGEIGERLSAISSKIGELEEAAAAERSKDEDKRKLAEILRREEYQKPAPEESLFDRLQRQFIEWLEKLFPRPNIPKTPVGGFESLGVLLQFLLYAVVLGLIGFLLYRFLPFFANRFGRRKKEKREERVILGERLAAHETADSLFSDAEALARAGDLRGAIRKAYVALLCELSDRKIIGLAQHKTNRDYLRDVRRRRGLHESLAGLTDNFERHWYGFEPAAEDDWDEFKRRYREAIGESS